MIRLFRESGAVPALLLTLLALALWSPCIINPPDLSQPYNSDTMPVWGYVIRVLSGSPRLAVIFSFVLMLVVAIVMVRFNTAIFFIPRRTILPSLMYVLLYSLFPGDMILNPALPAALLIVSGLWRMISSYRKNGMVFNFFDAAILISSAGLFYTGSVWFIILVFIGALILRSPDIRELTVALAGAMLPWIIMYALWYVTGGFVSDLTEIIRHNLFDHMPAIYWSRTLILLMIVTGLNFLPALFSLMGEMSTYKIRTRKTYELFFWMIVVCAAALAFVPSVSVELGAIAAIPVAFIMANYMALTRKVAIIETLLWLMVIMLAVTRVWPY
jgi:hypothetical protein